MATKKSSVAKAKPLGKTLKIKMSNGKNKTYTKKVCGKGKTEATSAVKKERAAGKLARMKKDPVTGKYCVFTAKSSAKKAPAKTAKKKRA